jgi:hypothetical protein
MSAEGAASADCSPALAAEAYEEILHGDPRGAAIEDGSYNFKKRFIALSRAGKPSPFPHWGNLSDRR